MSIDVSRFLTFLKRLRRAPETIRGCFHLDGPKVGLSNSRIFSSDIVPILRSY